MKISCQSCGFTEETNVELIVKVLGATMPAFGFFAWTSFLFAGTGFAMAICVAIIAGGPALLIYKDEIIQWLASKGYKCPKCGGEHWKAVADNSESLHSNMVKSDKSPEQATIKNAQGSNLRVSHEKKPRIKVIDTSKLFNLDDLKITDPDHIQELRVLSNVNNGAAENRLAQIYYSGIKTGQNYAKAFEYSNIAAQKGNIDAQFRLSNLYQKGWGVIRDEGLAEFWLKQSRLK